MANKFNPDFAHFDPLNNALPVLGPPSRTYGRKRVISKNFELVTGDLDTDDIIVFCPIPTGAVLHQFAIVNDVFDSVADLDINVGICDKDGGDINPGAGDSRLLFGSALDTWQTDTFPAAALEVCRGTVITAQNLPEAFGAQMWERVNLQTAAQFLQDPAVLWFLCVQIDLVPATAVAGTVGFAAEYTLD